MISALPATSPPTLPPPPRATCFYVSILYIPWARRISHAISPVSYPIWSCAYVLQARVTGASTPSATVLAPQAVRYTLATAYPPTSTEQIAHCPAIWCRHPRRASSITNPYLASTISPCLPPWLYSLPCHARLPFPSPPPNLASRSPRLGRRTWSASSLYRRQLDLSPTFAHGGRGPVMLVGEGRAAA